METLLLLLVIVALLLALTLTLRVNSQARKIGDLEDDLRRRSRTQTEETEEKLDTLRTLLARVAEGAPVSEEMIREGRLWRDVLPDEGVKLVEQGDLHVIDVRTADEVRGGTLPGAVHIPISELEERVAEVPRDARTKLVYCAGGGRSAAACEFLSREGFRELNNLAGGIGAWTGPVERP